MQKTKRLAIYFISFKKCKQSFVKNNSQTAKRLKHRVFCWKQWRHVFKSAILYSRDLSYTVKPETLTNPYYKSL